MLRKCIDRLVPSNITSHDHGNPVGSIPLLWFCTSGYSGSRPLMSTELDHGLTTAIRHDSVNKTKIPGTTILEGTNSLTNEGCTNDTKALKRHADYIEEHFIPVTPVC